MRKIKQSQKALGPRLIILSEMAQLHAHCVSKCGEDADKSIIIFEKKKKKEKTFSYCWLFLQKGIMFA